MTLHKGVIMHKVKSDIIRVMPACRKPRVEAISPQGGGGGGGGQQASCLVTKQAVEFPQVLASIIILHLCVHN